MDVMQEDLSWFYSDEWQAMEDEADEDYRAGRMKSYASVDDLLASLQSTSCRKKDAASSSLNRA